jgi:hypothetical protein
VVNRGSSGFCDFFCRAFILPMGPAGHRRLETEDRKDLRNLTYRGPLRESDLFVIPF